MRGFDEVVVRARMMKAIGTNDRATDIITRYRIQRVGRVEEWVLGLDGDEETVVGDPLEGAVGEERVVELRQTVEGQHADQRADGCKEDGRLEGHRNVRGQAEERLTADQERVIDRVCPPLEEDSGRCARETGEKNDVGQHRLLHAHGGIEAVDHERGMSVPPGVTGIAHFGGRGQELVHQVEARKVPVKLGVFGGVAHYSTSAPPISPW